MHPNFIALNSIASRNFDLDSIQIASPCRADWNAMSGDEQTRHCGSCAKNVYNLSALTREQAVRLIADKEGHLCVRLHRRADGTLITSNCTVGISRLKKPRFAAQKWVASVLAAILGALGVSSVQAARQTEVPTLGAPMLMGEIAPQQHQMTMGIIAPPKKKIQSQATKKHGKRIAKPARKTKPSLNRRHRR